MRRRTYSNGKEDKGRGEGRERGLKKIEGKT